MAGATTAVRASPRSAGADRGRVRMLDLLRLLAAVQMVQGHTIDAVLSVEARHGPLYAVWVWTRGLTSVAFLFVAGVAFHLVALRNLRTHARDPRAVARRFRRAATLIAIGYALHAPLALLWAGAPGPALAEAVIVDVLQCMGVGLLLLEGSALWLGSAARLRVACALLAFACLGAAPALARLEPDGALQPLLNYFSPRAGSLFPLVPWLAHMLLGVALAPFLLVPERRALRWALAGSSLFVAGRLCVLAEIPLSGMHLTRVGCVLWVGALIELCEPLTRRWPSWAMRLPGETLFIYVFHVLLVYGQGLGLAHALGPRLSPPLAVASALVMIAFSFGAALAYRGLRPALAGRPATG